jgi:hypothetical protein
MKHILSILGIITFFSVSYLVAIGKFSQYLPNQHEIAITIIFILGGISSLFLLIDDFFINKSDF